MKTFQRIFSICCVAALIACGPSAAQRAATSAAEHQPVVIQVNFDVFGPNSYWDKPPSATVDDTNRWGGGGVLALAGQSETVLAALASAGYARMFYHFVPNDYGSYWRGYALIPTTKDNSGWNCARSFALGDKASTCTVPIGTFQVGAADIVDVAGIKSVRFYCTPLPNEIGKLPIGSTSWLTGKINVNGDLQFGQRSECTVQLGPDGEPQL